MQRLRDNPGLNWFDQDWQTMAAEPRSTWPSGWDIINTEVSKHDPINSKQAIISHLIVHYQQILASLKKRNLGYLWIIPGDLHNMVNSYLRCEVRSDNGYTKLYNSKLLGLYHTFNIPKYVLANTKGVWHLCEAIYYDNDACYRAAPSGPHTITYYGVYLRFEFNYNPYEYGQHNDCVGCYNDRGKYVIQVNIASIPQSMARILEATQDAALQHAGLA